MKVARLFRTLHCTPQQHLRDYGALNMQAEGEAVDAEVRRAVCGSVAPGTDGTTFRLSLPAHALPASQEASIIKVLGPLTVFVQ